MEEINRLHDIADDIDRTSWGYQLADALHRIAAHIEEKVYEMRHVGEYEDDVLTFVEAYGGLEEVKKELSRSIDISGYESDVLGWVEKNGGLDAVKERTMPEGMSWPFYEDGEPVRIGGEVEVHPGCSFEVDNIAFEYGCFVLNAMRYRDGERVKRPAPKVLDADGVEIRVGDEVFVIATGKTHHVTVIDHIGKRFKSMEQMGDDATWLDPVCFTHRAPVLAADGRPLREGETVWHKSGLASGVVVSIDAGSLMHTVRYRDESGVEYRDAAKDLTHERPDSWERWVEDTDKSPCEYFGVTGSGCDGCRRDPYMCDHERNEDLVRRAKKLPKGCE